MQDDEAAAESPAPTKPKRKIKRRSRRKVAARAPRPPKASDEFPGLKPADCCATCGQGRCVISGVAHCAHPFKGGLPTELKADQEALARFSRAQKALAGQTLKVD